MPVSTKADTQDNVLSTLQLSRVETALSRNSATAR